MPVFMLALASAACGSDGGPAGVMMPVASYALSGSVAHLDTGGVTLSDGAETLAIAQGATSFAFAKPLATGTGYTVSVTAQPAGETCTVANAAGTITGAAVSNVAVTCSTLVSQPLAIGVSATGTRIFLPVSQVGTVATGINAILDTGSAGVVLRASDVFPASMVSSSGFSFPAGQTSLSYNGITVTNVVASRTYGSQGATTTVETGNLGFAQVTFGSGAHVTTTSIPVLFVYQTTANGVAVATSNFANLIGVNPGLNAVTVGGAAATAPLAPCTPQSTATCGEASPFRYLGYAAGTDEGFVASRVAFSSCDIATPGSCPVQPNLTLGISAATLAGFNTTALSCSQVVLGGPAAEPVCSQVIPGVTVTSGGASFTGPIIFDSGYPTIRLSVPAGTAFPAALADGATVDVATPSGFAYQFTTGTGFYTTTVTTGATASDFSNSGVAFFARNSLLVDYARALEGWRNGS